jgi:hypothetical protein
MPCVFHILRVKSIDDDGQLPNAKLLRRKSEAILDILRRIFPHFLLILSSNILLPASPLADEPSQQLGIA